MSRFVSRKTRNEGLRAAGAAVFSSFATDDAFWNEQLVPYFAQLMVAFKSKQIQTLDEAEIQVRALEAQPPLKRALCSAAILYSTRESIRGAGAAGAYYCDLVLIAGTTGSCDCVQNVIDRKNREQARQLVSALDVLADSASGIYRAQAIYMRGHLQYGVLGASAADFAASLRDALAELESDPQPRLIDARTVQRKAWMELLTRVDAA